MAFTPKVQESLDEAKGCLRNALHHAAKNESPTALTSISKLIAQLDALGEVDSLLDAMSKKFNNKGPDLFF